MKLVKPVIPISCEAIYLRPIPEDNRPRPLQARDAILGLVKRGEHQPGSRLPSERQLADRLNVRCQLQLHKFIWAPERRGV